MDRTVDQLCITGASGFLGRRFVSACLERSDTVLRVLTRDPSSFSLPAPRQASVTVCEGDLLDQASLGRFLQSNATVVNLAYLHEGRIPNLRAAANLSRAALNSGAKRLVHCSTAAVVGFAERGVITEETPEHPAGQYQGTKYEIERILKGELLPAVELSILRPSEIIGPGGEGLRKMIMRLRNGRASVNALYRLALKHRRFNYVAVDNVVAALQLLVATPEPQRGDVYQISDDDDPDNIYAAVEAIIRRSLGSGAGTWLDVGLPAPVLSLLYRCFPDSAPPDRIYETSKIAALGYEKATTLRSAIIEVVAAEVGPSLARASLDR